MSLVGLLAQVGEPGADVAALGLVLLAAAALLVIAYYVSVPYPIVLVVGGLAIGYAPGVPNVDLAPELVLVLFLPPLLYSAAFFTSLRDLRANLRPITSLALGLVVTSTVVVGVVAHTVVDDLSWAAAFTLGAVLAPTDPVAATAIAGRLGAPRRFVTVIEGESLINDASALILFKFAVAAAATGSFSALDAAGEFVWSSVVGVLVGIGVGAAVAWVRRPLDDPPTEIAISIMTPFLAYVPAELLGASGVVSAVTAGIWLGLRAHVLVTPETRLQSNATWEVLQFVLNAALFLLLGTQLPGVLEGAAGEVAPLDVVGWVAAVFGALLLTRFAWTFGQRAVRKIGRGQEREARRPLAPVGETFLVGFTGMRGAVSLAAALAIPVTLENGEPFPGRDVIVLVVYLVILTTLLGQGLMLPRLIRLIGLDEAAEIEAREAKARVKAARAARSRLDELADEDWVSEDTVRRMHGLYEFREQRFRARLDGEDDGRTEHRSRNYQRLRREALEAERRELMRLRDTGFVPAESVSRMQRDIDLEIARLG